MAGPRIAVELDTAKVVRAINALQAAGQDLRPAFNDIGRILKTHIALAFRRGVDPYGNPWERLKVRDGQPLRDSGRLARSFDYQATDKELQVGTNVEYAAIHQFGGEIQVPEHVRLITKAFGKPLKFPVWGTWKAHTRTVTARPFLPTKGLPDNVEKRAVGVLIKHLQDAI